MEPNLHSSLGHSRQASQTWLRIVPLTNVAEQQRISRREFSDRLPKVEDLRKLRDILGGRYAVQELDWRLCYRSRPCAPRQLAQRLVAGDLPDPPDLGAALALTGTAPPGAQERVLGRLLGVLL